jgi:hypothetical protein
MKVLDVVALTKDQAEADLRRGQVATIVEELAQGVYEVEFADLEGRTHAMLPLPAKHLMVLHHTPTKNAA